MGGAAVTIGMVRRRITTQSSARERIIRTFSKASALVKKMVFNLKRLLNIGVA
jgi:hypothetical protein